MNKASLLRGLWRNLLVLPVVMAAMLANAAHGEDTPYTNVIFEFFRLDQANGAGTAPPTPAIAGTSVQAVFPNRADRKLSTLQATDEYAGRIQSLKEENGPYSSELREEYESLGVRLQRQGDHEEAIKAFESASHIERVNNGLFTPSQIPLVKHIIDSYTAMSEFDKAADQHEYLYYVQQRAYAPGSKEALAAKQEWADWNLQYFLTDAITQPLLGERLNFSGGMNRVGRRITYVAVQNTGNGFTYYIPQDVSRAYSTGPMTADDVLDIRLYKARQAYAELLKQPANTAEERKALMMKKANAAMAIKRQMDSVDRVDDGPQYMGSKIGFVSPHDNLVVMNAYATTRDDLQSLAKEQERVSPAAAADAWLAVGDWELRFGNQQTGKKAYEKALDLLAQAGGTADEQARAFNPGPLTLVPAFAVQPFTRAFFGISPQAALNYRGHIDLALNVTELGQIRSLEITDATPNTSVVMRRMLLTYLRKQPVRPLVQDGKLVKESALSLRVYYAY